MSNKQPGLTVNLKNIHLPEAEIKNFCQRWYIRELAVFGSALRDDFRPDSDLDILVTFEPEADWSLFDHLQMKEELGQLLKREIDLLTRQAVEHSHNIPRRQAILDSAQTVYVSQSSYDNPWQSLFDSLAQFSDDFMEDRDQPIG